MGPKKPNVEEKKKRQSSSVEEEFQPKIDEQFCAQPSRKEMEEIMCKLDKLASKEFIESTMCTLKTDLVEHVRVEVNKIHSIVKAVESRTAKVEKGLELTKNVISDQETRLSTAERTCKLVQEENKKLKEQIKEREKVLQVKSKEINNLEQYTRRNSVRIYGIDDRNPRESVQETAEKVLNMCRDKLEMDFSVAEIDIAHRLGRFSVEGNRPILCKFISRQNVLKVLQSRRKCKGTGIVIREDLTQANIKLLEKVNQLSGIKQAWSEQGKIIALLQDGTRKMVVDQDTDLSMYS